MAGGPWYHLHLLLNIFTSFYCTDSQVLCVPAVKYLTETSVILWTKWETDEKYSRSTFTGVNRVMLWNVLYHHCRRNQPWFWRVCCCGAARRMFRSLHMSTSLSSSVCFFSLHLQSNGLPSWCSASLLSAGQIHPCFRDMLRHLSRMRVDNPQQISLIKARRDTDLNIFTTGGGLQKPSAMIFFFFSLPRSAQCKASEKMPFGLSVAPPLPNVVLLHHELFSCSFNVFQECRDAHPNSHFQSCHQLE